MKALLPLLPLLLVVAPFQALRAAGPVWLRDLEEAKRLALKQQKRVLVFFTGSTWCGPCKELHAELLPSPEFAKFAQAHVLVLLDYPPFEDMTAGKAKADPARAKLVEIQKRYRISGFPVMMVLSPAGDVLFRKWGYTKGVAPAVYLADLS